MDGFTTIEREMVHAEVATWVPGGPPDDAINRYGSVEIFEHEVSGYMVGYQTIDRDDGPWVVVSRVRRRRAY